MSGLLRTNALAQGAKGETLARLTNGALIGALASTVGFVLVELVYLNKQTSQISGKSLAIAMMSGAGAFAVGAIGLQALGFDKQAHPLLKHIKDGAGIGVLVSAPVLFVAATFGDKDMDARKVLIISSSVIMACAAIGMAIFLVDKNKGSKSAGTLA